MDLIPVTKKSGPETEPPSGSTEKETSAESESSTEMGTMDHSKHGMGVPAPEGGEGEPRSQFTVSPERQQIIGVRSEEHTSELQSLMRISYAVFCLKKKK